jgi:alpha-ribazole phosphatase
MNKQIYLLRHTTPAVEKGICYGQTDLDVAESFEQEILQIQQCLPALQAIQVYTSPLQRCKKLAIKLTQNQDPHLSLVEDPRLMEMFFGEWEMKPWANLPTQMLKAWMSDFVNVPAPTGESHRQVHERVMAFWKEKLAMPHETFAVVTHYGVIQSLLAHLLHIPLDKLFKIDMGFGAVVRVTLGEDDYCKVKFLR